MRFFNQTQITKKEEQKTDMLRALQTKSGRPLMTHYRDEAAHDEEKQEGEDQDAEQGVDLVPPHAREDVVQLDVDGAERKEARHDHLGRVAAVPRDIFRDLSAKTTSGRIQTQKLYKS